jgi:hypothetical protein
MKSLNTPVREDVCAPDIALSIQNGFHTAAKSFFPMQSAPPVDTGTAVISRKAARLFGRTASQLKAIMVDRFFETKREAYGWSNAHSEFMMLRVIPPDASGPTEP